MAYCLRNDAKGSYLAEYETFDVMLEGREQELTDRQVLQLIRRKWTRQNRDKAVVDGISMIQRHGALAVVRLYYLRSDA